MSNDTNWPLPDRPVEIQENFIHHRIIESPNYRIIESLSNLRIIELKDRIMKKLIASDKFILWLWIALPIVNWSIDFFKDRYNNFKIFKAMFWHVVEQKNIYAAYPLEHYDFFHYGPAFSLIIGPFAVLPDIVGAPLWGLFNVLILYYALNRLSVKPHLKI